MQSGDNNIIPFNNIGLGHFSYLVVSKDKECAIIDPIFLIDDYVKEIESGKLLLKFIFLTHIQSEFIMGHNRLKEKYP